jgi:hypothetical protein
MVSLKFSDIGLSIVGGIMFLRLINPAIVSPIKYNILDEVTPDGQRGLLIVSKIFQRLANEEYFNEEMEPHMAFANRWIRKSLPKWRSVFYEFMVTKTRVTCIYFVDWKTYRERRILGFYGGYP